MADGNGHIRKVHPILASYVADYPEQCLVTTAKYNSCPKCYADKKNLGEDKAHRPRTAADTLESLDTCLEHHRAFHRVCKEPEHLLSGHVPSPFWESLPYTDIHASITPDVLHQLYGGVVEHLIEWCQKIVGKDKLDERLCQFPLSHGIRHFDKGFSNLVKISGPERKQMAKLLLCGVSGFAPKDVIRATRAVLDFTYIAQYASHSDETLQYLNDACQAFHDNKQIFIDLSVRTDFDIPKLHSLHKDFWLASTNHLPSLLQDSIKCSYLFLSIQPT